MSLATNGCTGFDGKPLNGSDFFRESEVDSEPIYHVSQITPYVDVDKDVWGEVLGGE